MNCKKCGAKMKPHSTRGWYCSPCNAAASKEWARNNPKRNSFNAKRTRAKEKGIEFSIEFDAVEWPTHCPILGVELSYKSSEGSKRGPRANSASFDRVDCTKGYVPGNVAVISNRANMIKNCGSAAEHRAIAEWMDTHNNNKECRP